MTYRKLTLEELEALQPEFVRFLASQSITAADWKKMTTQNPEKSSEWIAIFSDMVIEKSLRQVSYLEHRTAQELKIFHCDDEKITLISIDVTDEKFDFLNNNLADLANVDFSKISVSQISKKYHLPREREIFGMLSWGCSLSNKSTFDALQKLV